MFSIFSMSPLVRTPSLTKILERSRMFWSILEYSHAFPNVLDSARAVHNLARAIHNSARAEPAPLAALPGWALTIPRASSPGNGERHAASADCGPHHGEDLLADCLVCAAWCCCVLLADTMPPRFTLATFIS